MQIVCCEINVSGVFVLSVIWLKSAWDKYGRAKIVENFIKISSHINKLIVYFGTFFKDEAMSRDERLKFSTQSSLLHRKLVDDSDLISYDKHIILAKQAYKIMLNKVKSQQIVDDILFCGSSEFSWEETRTFLLNLYGIDMHIKEIYAFYYLDEINNMFYIDSPLPSRNSVSL